MTLLKWNTSKPICMFIICSAIITLVGVLFISIWDSLASTFYATLVWLKNHPSLSGHLLNIFGILVTLVGILVGAFLVVLQLGRQHNSSLELQRDNFRLGIKIRLYETLIEKTRTLSTSCVDAGTYTYNVPFHLEAILKLVLQGSKPTAINKSASELLKLHESVNEHTTNLLYEFESWQIVLNDLYVFKLGFMSSIYDERIEFQSLYKEMLNVLPITPQDVGAVGRMIRFLNGPHPDKNIENLKILVQNYKDKIDEIASYVYDLTREAQNNLLSGLFEGNAQPRKPLDPRYKVISTDPEKTAELIDYFENETPWGKYKKTIEASVKANLKHNRLSP